MKRIITSPFWRSNEFVWLLTIAGLVLVVFGPLLSAPPLNWDDDSNIFQNPHYQAGEWTVFWEQAYFGLYVPVTYWVWGVVYWLGGGAAWPFRALNLILHLANVTLVYFLLKALARRWQLNAVAVMVALAFFALHPMQVHAVAWISGGRDLLAAFFSLAAIAVYFSRRDISGAGLSSLLFIFALLSKPSVAILPAVIVALAYLVGERPRRAEWIKLGVWTLLSAGVIVLTRQAQAEATDPGVGFFRSILVALDTYSYYVLKVVFPFPLSANYGRPPEVALADPGLIWWVLLGAGILGGLGFLAWKVDRHYAMIGVWALALLPVSGLVPFAYQRISTVSDHYNYLPMAALATLLAVILTRVTWMVTHPRMQPLTLGVVVAALAVLSRERTHAWVNNEAFFNDMRIVAPDSYSTAIGMSLVSCSEKADYEDGVRWTEKALIARPNDIMALANQAYCFLHAKNYFRVIELELRLGDLDLDMLEHKQPTAYASLLASIGTAYIEQQDYDDGYQFLCEAYRIKPADPTHKRNLDLATAILIENKLNPDCNVPPDDEPGGPVLPDEEPVQEVWPEEPVEEPTEEGEE